MSTSSSYRPDIDGLRAIAVVAVILFHFDVPGFPGGFTGVDVFFVISGFLIIRIILNELAADSFSLLTFWERRVRRIIPAMVVVLFVTAIASYHFILVPSDYDDFGGSLMYQSAFVSNVWFMSESEYFAGPAETMPLLHTWTLAVEEQFYVLFPLLALALYPILKRRFGVVLVVVAVASFAYSVWLSVEVPEGWFGIPFVPHVWGSAENVSAAFYFLLPRLWEFLVGGLIAAYTVVIRHRLLAEVVSFLGLLAIIVGIVVVSEEHPFPGYAALLPVLGTAAVIVANAQHATLVSKLLSFKTVVWVGLISYSLYLWHWPVIVLAKSQLFFDQALSPGDLVVLGALVVLLSFLTYRYVETPFRTKAYLASRTKLFGAAAASLVVLFVAGWQIASNEGYPKRLSSEGQLIAASMSDINPRKEECFARSRVGMDFATAEPCLLGAQNPDDISYVLWGDSHANAVMTAFDTYGTETGQTGVFFGVAACPPVVSDRPLSSKPECLTETEKAISYITDQKPEEVFLVAEWVPWYPYKDGEQSEGRALSDVLARSFAALPSETQFTLFHRLQTFPADHTHRNVLLASEQDALELQITMPRSGYVEALRPFYEQVTAGVAGFANVRTRDVITTACDTVNCHIGTSEGLYYHDASHLSTFGAQELVLPILLKGETAVRDTQTGTSW